MNNQSIVLGGGCFWCLDAIYRLQRGVTEVISGYAGGTTASPSFEDVCTGSTGHAEVVRVSFDPEVTNLAAILDLFFQAHDPTTPNQQGADIGSQYRSVILFNEGQESEVTAALSRAKEVWGSGIVTEVRPLEEFFEAEDFHQDYYNKNPNQGYCQAVIAPKIAKLQ